MSKHLDSKATHDKLGSIGVRIFKIHLNDSTMQGEELFFVHANKITSKWRKDLAAFLRKGRQVDDLKKADVRTTGFASDNVFNALIEHMMRLGYHEINDVVSDVYEGRMTNEASRLVDDPAHDDIQEDGFGHYGWESKKAHRVKLQRNEKETS